MCNISCPTPLLYSIHTCDDYVMIPTAVFSEKVQCDKVTAPYSTSIAPPVPPCTSAHHRGGGAPGPGRGHVCERAKRVHIDAVSTV
jgi:hypothetical protein